MPLITCLAPGTRVEVPGMILPEAVIEQVILRSGVNPVLYHLRYRDGLTTRTATFPGSAVEESAIQPATGFADLGRMMAESLGGK